MQKFSVKEQKNVYYVDVDSETYKGYIETSFELSERLEYLEYRFAGLEIQNVFLIANGKESELSFNINEVEYKKYLKSFNTNFIKDCINSQILKINLNLEIEFFKIRICYSRMENNFCVQFYDNSGHKECLGENINNSSICIFPNLIYPFSYSFNLYYIIKGPLSVVSPGELIGTIEESDLTIFNYFCEFSLPENISFCCGTFDSLEIINGEDSKLVYFPLNQNEGVNVIKENLKEVLQDFSTAIRFFESFLDFEFLRTSIVFTKIHSNSYGINVCYLNCSVIPELNSIETNFEFKEHICNFLSRIIVCNFIGSDYIKNGMGCYLEDNCLCHFFGKNELIFRLQKEKEFVIKNDIRELPLNDPKRTLFSNHSNFFKSKSKLFFWLLEKHLSKAFLQKIISAILERKFTNTEDFIKTIKNVTGKDMFNLFDFYVNKPGLIIFNCSFEIDQKKNKVNLQIKQKPTSQLINCNRKMTGNLVIKAYEVEGNFEHNFNLQKNEISFHYHTRTKKRKKEIETLPLLWLRIDPKKEFLAGIELNQPDFMFIEALIHEKSLEGQLEALYSLEKRPSEQTCAVFERVCTTPQYFYKLKIEAMNALSQINLPEYDGYQRLIQLFIKRHCIQGSTIIRPNDFSNFQNYFLQKYLITSLSFSFPFFKKMIYEREVIVRDVIASFLNNVLIYNDNESNAFGDSFYLAEALGSLSFPLCMQELKNETFFNENDSNFAAENNFFEEPEENFKRVKIAFENEEFSEKKIFFQLTDKHKNSLINTLKLIERYRKLDLIFPSNYNILTVKCLYTLGRLFLYGQVDLNRSLMYNYSRKENFLLVRLIAFEIILFFKKEDDLFYIFQVLKEENYSIKKHILLCIKKMLSTTLTNDFILLLKQYKHYFYELSQFLIADTYLFELILEIILFLEDKGKEIKKIEEKHFYEFKEELKIEEKDEESEEIKLRLEQQKPVILIPTRYFIEEFIEQIKSKPEIKHQKIKIEIKQTKVCNPKDFKIQIKKYKPKLKKDEFLLFYEKLNPKDYFIIELFKQENVCKIDELINLFKNEQFFQFEPLTLQEIQDSSDRPLNLLLTLIFCITFEKYGSKFYLQLKNMISNLEKLFYDLLLPVFYSDNQNDLQIEINSVLKEECLLFVEFLIGLPESELFLNFVDYKSLKLLKYVDVVRSPTCILHVKTKLQNNNYCSKLLFIAELRQVFINCLLFNHKDSLIYADALFLLNLVDTFYLIGGFNSEDNKKPDFLNVIKENCVNKQSLINEYKQKSLPELINILARNRISKRKLNQLIHKLILLLKEMPEAKHFIYKVEDLIYKQKITRQMYLQKLIYKSEAEVYVSLGHFFSDYKLIRENCVNFNGQNSFFTKENRVMDKEFRKLVWVCFGDDVMRIFGGK